MTRRWLGIDYGARRIGVAIADEGLRVARPLAVVSSLDELKQIIIKQSATDLVLGLPRSLDGGDTTQTAEVRSFGQQLRALGLPVSLQDEAGTSPAQQSKSKAVDDAAAAIILQDFLDNL
jgi:putative Holliday junction resolvase